MKVCIVAGGRLLGELHRGWWEALAAAETKLGPFDAIWTGACGMDVGDPEDRLTGGDALAVRWARMTNHMVELFPAPWSMQREVTRGRSGPAGPRRIGDMFAGRRGYTLRKSGRGMKLETTEHVEGEVVACVLLPGRNGTDRTGEVADRNGVPIESIPMQWLAGEPHPVHASTVSPEDESVVYVGPDSHGWQGSALCPPFRLSSDRDLDRYKAWLAGALGLTYGGERIIPLVVAALDNIGPDSLLACWDIGEDGYGLTYTTSIVDAWRYVTNKRREQGQP